MTQNCLKRAGYTADSCWSGRPLRLLTGQLPRQKAKMSSLPTSRLVLALAALEQLTFSCQHCWQMFEPRGTKTKVPGPGCHLGLLASLFYFHNLQRRAKIWNHNINMFALFFQDAIFSAECGFFWSDRNERSRGNRLFVLKLFCGWYFLTWEWRSVVYLGAATACTIYFSIQGKKIS